jgi:glycosyltransferase involved in cell wall biosynthesis
MKKKQPLVSTITPVLNGAQYIKENLKSIRGQTYSNIEMIVVDNFSTDKSAEIAKKMGATVYKKGPERTAQDNYGVKKAKGKYVFITGCDMVLDKNYIKQCVEACESDGFDAIYASVRSKTVNFWSKVKGLERDSYIGDDLIESARFFKKKVFLDVGGYDGSLVIHSDDYDMQRRLNLAGYKTGRIPSVETHIDEIDSLKEVFLKSFYYGINSLDYLKKHKGYAAGQLMPVRSAYFRNYKLFLRHPILTLGFIFFKIIQYASGSLGLLFAALKLTSVSEKFHKKIYKKL